jgi:acyl dehydratase
MMTLDEYLCIGETITLGAHTFTPDEIVAFAKKFDPQPFHLSEETAKGSVFGALCASGWQTAANWMKYNLKTGFSLNVGQWDGEGPEPQFGPALGIQNLKWLKPVYAGETVTYTRRATGHRPLASRPGWRVVNIWGEGHDSGGAKVLEFESSVLVNAPGA